MLPVVLLAVVLAAEGTRPRTGGVPMRGVPGFEDLGVLGFDHELKKSSSVSSAGAALAAAFIPST